MFFNFRNNLKDIKSTKETQIHNSRTNLINDRDIYVEDIIDQADEQDYVDTKKKRISEQQIDDDSLRRHEIDRGSDIGYDQRNNMKRQLVQENENATNRDHLYIKDGNAEILRLITRGKQEEENIYVNVPPVQPQPQYIMVDNSGKEILMRRFIEEQANGKQIIREHYQILPGNQIHQSLPNEVTHSQQMNELYVNKSQAGSVIYSQHDPNFDLKFLSSQNLNKSDTQQQLDTQRTYNIPNQSVVHQELETSLKQQNALLRQILLEKAKLEEKYSQQEVALETQSLPGHAMAIATQTDCETGTQTDEPYNIKPERRRAKSENDDSMSESDYEYIRYSPPNSPEGVYWIKRKRHKRKSKHRDAIKPRRRVVMVEEIKRKIRTPIEEENEDQRSPVKSSDTRSNILKRIKKDSGLKRKEISAKSVALKKDILMEISDSLDEQASPTGMTKKKQIHKIHKKQIEYFDDSDDPSDDDDPFGRDNYSGDSLENYSEIEESQIRRSSSRISRNRAMLRRGSSIDIRDVYNKDEDYVKYVSDSIASTPAIRHRLSRKDSKNDPVDGKRKVKRDSASEPPVHRSNKRPAPKAPILKPTNVSSTDKSRSETDILRKMDEDSGQSSRSVPKYMEWYYNKNRDIDSEKKRLDNYRSEKEKSKISNKKIIGSTEKRIKSKVPKSDGQQSKPEPLPRSIPSKGIRMLKEDIDMNKAHNPKIQTDANHPLLQYSEHRYEYEYNPAPDIPIPPTKLPHYIYPETPPQHGEAKQKSKPTATTTSTTVTTKSRPSPIKENEVKTTSHKTVIPIEASETAPSNPSKQLNASTLEDDLDSGIAMNSLLNSMGRRNPIADKKSVFTIAYDDVKVKKIQSESDSPQFS